MSFRLKLNEAMEVGIRRVGLGQIDRALAHVSAGDTAAAATPDAIRAVHETRKCVKRLRALLVFARPLMEKSAHRAFDRSARDLGRRMSATRDLDVLDHTLAKLQAAAVLKSTTFERLHRSLNAARSEITPGGADATRLIADFGELRENWIAVTIETQGRTLVTDGLGYALDACREQFERAFASDDGENFHDWRKSVQLHWRHMQLVQRAWPEYCRARLGEARAISQLVGDDRDLAMLGAFAAAKGLPQTCLRDIERATTRLSPGYRQEAKARGERLLAEGTRGFCRRLENYWQASQQLRKLERGDEGKSEPKVE